MKAAAPLIAGIAVALALCSGVLAQSRPDFSITVSDPEVTAPVQGGDNWPGLGGATYHGTLTALNGYNRPVTLSCVNSLVAGCYFDNSTIVPGASGTPFTLLAATGASDMGDVNFFVKGIGGDSTEHQLPLIMHVFSFGVPGGFLNPTITVPAGSVSSPVNITYTIFGSSAHPPVTFFCGSLPPGVTCNTYPAISVLTTVTTSAHTMSVATSTPPGTYFGYFAARAIPANATPFTRGGGGFTLVVQPASGLTADVSIASVESIDVQPVAVGKLATFTAQVNNSGPDAAHSKVSFVFSPSASIYSVTGSEDCVIATNLTCDLGQLASGTGATVSVTVRAPFTRTFSATAFATSNAVDPNPGNNVLGSNAIAIRLRPLARKGLPVGQP